MYFFSHRIFLNFLWSYIFSQCPIFELWLFIVMKCAASKQALLNLYNSRQTRMLLLMMVDFKFSRNCGLKKMTFPVSGIIFFRFKRVQKSWYQKPLDPLGFTERPDRIAKYRNRIRIYRFFGFNFQPSFCNIPQFFYIVEIFEEIL